MSSHSSATSSASLFIAASFVKIDDLPNEMLWEVFSNLGARDLINCMMVSKKWNSFCHDVNIKELIFNDSYTSKWWTNDLFKEKNMFNSLHISKLESFPLNITHLQRLVLFDNRNYDFQLGNLNKFPQLQHLELSYFKQESQQSTIFLNLPNLKILYCCVNECSIIFNTPTLTSVYLSASKKVRFRNLSTLKLLEVDSMFKCFFKFSRIKRVKIFRTLYNRNLNKVSSVLSSLDDLKEIRFNFQLLANAICRSYLRKWIDRILAEKRRLNKPNVKIYLFDILLEDGKQIEEYGFNDGYILNKCLGCIRTM